MSGSGANLGVILKMAFVMAIFLYLGIAIAIAGPPRWDAPWVPEQPPGSMLAVVLPALAFGALVAGFLLGRKPAPDPLPQAAGQPWAVTRFILGAAVTESAAILMLGLSLVAKDARWAILGAVSAAAVLLLAPVSAGDGPGN